MSYQNLKAELKREGFSYSQVAEILGMSVNNVSLKMNERVPMTVEEIKKIQKAFFPGAGLDYLLASDGEDEPARPIEVDELRVKSRRTDPEHVIRAIG